MTLLFRLLPAGMSRDGFTRGNKALDVYWRTQAGQHRGEENNYVISTRCLY